MALEAVNMLGQFFYRGNEVGLRKRNQTIWTPCFGDKFLRELKTLYMRKDRNISKM